MSCHETLGTQIAIMLGSTASTVGTVAAVFGAFGVVSLLSMAILCKRFRDMQLIGWSLIAMAVSAITIAFSLSGGQNDITGLVFFMLATLVVYSTAYPIGHTAVLGHFSKVSVTGAATVSCRFRTCIKAFALCVKVAQGHTTYATKKT
jgi:ceroid-lipofuscinosis MFS transporter 7